MRALGRHDQPRGARLAVPLLALLCGLGAALGGCNPQRTELPPARCQRDRDCPGGLSCSNGVCKATGWIEGAVRCRDPSRPPPGKLRVAVYRASEVKPEGPKGGAKELAPSAVIESPRYPQPFRIEGFPRGDHVVFATTVDDADGGSPSRQLMGQARFKSLGGGDVTPLGAGRGSRSIDVMLHPRPRHRTLPQ